MKKKQKLISQLIKEAKKSKGSGSGSLFVIVIFIAISFFGIAMVGGGAPSLRSTARLDQLPPPKTNSQQATSPNAEQDKSLSPSPSPGF